MEAQSKEASRLNELRQIYRRELPDYLPTGLPLRSKLQFLRVPAVNQLVADGSRALGIVRGITGTAADQFKGTDIANKLQRFRIVGRSRGEVLPIFCTTPLEVNDMVICRPQAGSIDGLLLQLAEVGRVVYEDTEPYILVKLWHPVLKPGKHQDRINYFGTWTRTDGPLVLENGDIKSAKKRKTAGGEPSSRSGGAGDTGGGFVMIAMADVLVWPIRTTSGESGPWEHGQACCLPVEVFEFLRLNCDINMCKKEFCFSSKGEEYYLKVYNEFPQ